MRPAWPREPIEYVAWAFVSALFVVALVASYFLLRGGLASLPAVLLVLYVTGLVFVGVVFDVMATSRFRVALWVGLIAGESYHYAAEGGGLLSLAIVAFGVVALGHELLVTFGR